MPFRPEQKHGLSTFQNQSIESFDLEDKLERFRGGGSKRLVLFRNEKYSNLNVMAFVVNF